MADREALQAYEDDFARQGSFEPPEPPCSCGAITDGPEDSGLCRECWLLSLPVCAGCGGSPGTEYVGEDFRLCWKCERDYNAGAWSPDEGARAWRAGWKDGCRMKEARRIMVTGEDWVNVNDLRDAMNDDDMILRAAAMLKVSHVKHHDSAVESLRRAIAYFFTETTGVLRHEEN